MNEHFSSQRMQQTNSAPSNSGRVPPHPAVTNPRVVFGVICTVGCVALIASFFNLSARINGSYDSSQALPETSLSDLSNPSFASLENGTTDSDKDGLTDADELRLYGTSPYIRDTDGDGISDQEEITRGSDPNCPEGVECREVPAPKDASEPQQQQKDAAELQQLQQVQEKLGADATENTLPGIGLTASELRQTLLASGQITEAQLSQIDDATLLQLSEQIQAEQAQSQ